MQKQTELAMLLEVKQSAISDAKRRKKIPAEWLLALLKIKKVNPEWIMSGKKPCFILGDTDSLGNGYSPLQISMELQKAPKKLATYCSTDELLAELLLRALHNLF